MIKKLFKLSGIIGGILGIAAIISSSTYPSKVILNASLAVLSLILLLTFFISHFEPFKAFSRKRSTQLGLNSIMMIILFIFITVVFNLVARQYYFRTDLSSTSDFSLAQQTVSVVKQLKGETRIKVFGQEGSPTYSKAKDLLDSYRYLNRNIVYSVIDLDKAPLMAKKYEIDQYDSILIETAGKHVVVQGISEETITNAIIKASRDVKKKIYFIAGHGEKDIHNKGRNGLYQAASKLSSIGHEISTLILASSESVPADTDLLIISGPKENFGQDDIMKLDEFIQQGGKLLALFDPGYDPSQIIGKVGLQMLEGHVKDDASNLGGKDPMVPLVSSYPDTPITRNFTLSTAYPGVASIRFGGLALFYDYFAVAFTSSESNIVMNSSPASKKEEHVIAAAAGAKEGKNIVLVFGDSDFVSNAFFDVAGNGNMFLNSVNWLLEEGDLVSIIPRRDDFIPLYLTPEQGTVIFYVSVVGIPLIVFGTGFTVWWKRRSL